MKRRPLAARRHDLVTFGASILTLVLAISVTSAVPIAASGELARPVIVSNPTSNPVPTRDTENPARNSVSFSLGGSGGDLFFLTNAQIYQACYTVPAGKELVLQSFTYFSHFTTTTEHLVQVEIVSSTVVAAALIPPVSDGTASFESGTVNVTVYAPPGSVVNCVAQRNSTASDGASVNMFMTGYLVTVP